MVYFDAAYIAKCYLNEPNAHLVRQFAYQADGLGSCEIARVEFCSVVQRHLREGNISSQEAEAVLKDFEQDEEHGGLGMVSDHFSVDSPGLYQHQLFAEHSTFARCRCHSPRLR